MLLISIAAVIAYALVLGRATWFCVVGTQYRQDDRTEVAFLMAASLIFMLGHVMLWFTEPWKLVNNSVARSIFAGFTVFKAAYYFRRVGALLDGRDHRHVERRIRRAHG